MIVDQRNNIHDCRGIPLMEVFWLPAPFRFIPSNLSWFCVSIFWKAYKLAIKFSLSPSIDPRSLVH